MVKRKAAPVRGEVIWVVTASVTKGERPVHRASVVLSPEAYNASSGLCLVCPLSNQRTDMPFEVPVTVEGIEGAVLSDQLRTISWIEHGGTSIDILSSDQLQEVIERARLLLPDAVA